MPDRRPFLSRPLHAAGAGRRTGQATVEMVLVSLLVLPLVLGAIEIGRGVWYYNQINQLAREGARWMIVTAVDGSTDHALPGNTPGTYTVASCGCGGQTAVGWIARQDIGIPRDRLIVTIQRGAIGAYTWGMPVTVTLQYPYQPLMAAMLNIPATIPLRAATTMHMQ